MFYPSSSKITLIITTTVVRTKNYCYNINLFARKIFQKVLLCSKIIIEGERRVVDMRSFNILHIRSTLHYPFFAGGRIRKMNCLVEQK